MHLPHIFHLPPLPPELDWLPPLLGIAALLLLLRMAVRGACRLCLLGILILLALAAFPHRDLTLFALGGPRRLVPDTRTESKRKKTRRQALKRSSLSAAPPFQTHRTGLVLPSWLSES